MDRIGFLLPKSRGHFGICVIFTALLLIPITSPVWATNEVGLSSSIGPCSSDTLWLNAYNTINIDIQNDIKISRMNLGFCLYSPDGAGWTWANVGGYGNTTHAVTKISGSRMDPGYEVFEASGLQVNELNVDGISPDSILISGISDTGGVEPGPRQIMLALHIMPRQAAIYKTICFDSASSSPDGDWVFADILGNPTIPTIGWGTGGVCWPVRPLPNCGINFTNCPQNVVEGNRCQNFAFQPSVMGCDPNDLTMAVSTTGSGSATVSGSGLVTYVPVPADAGKTIQIGIAATACPYSFSATCTIQLHLAGTPPTIDARHSFNSVGINNHFVKHDIIGTSGGDPCSQLSYSIASGPGDIDPVTGVYEWTPQVSDTGTHDIIVQVNDGGMFARDTFQLIVVPEDMPGNANCTDDVNVGDVVFLIAYIFRGGIAPPIADWADVNHDCKVNVGDAVWLINYIFKNGPAPAKGCVE